MILNAVVAATALFAILPGIVVFLASFTGGHSLAFPPDGLSLQWYAALLANKTFLPALATSLTLATVTAVGATAIASLAAVALIRHPGRFASSIEAMLLSPMAVPHVIIGIGMLQIYSYMALRADLMTLTMGHLIITIPFALRLLIASLSGLDRRVEMAAASLGASPVKAFFTVVLPQMKVGIVGSLIATFILSFDDVALTIFLVQPGYITVPIRLFSEAENNPTPAIHAASVVLLVASWIGIIAIDRIVGFEKVVFAGRAGH